MRTINSEGLALVKKAEGLRLKAYRDIGGVLTIGFGHTGPDITPDTFISAEHAEELLEQDLEIAEECVDKATIVPLTDNQFSALVSLCFNIGCKAFAGSTLVRLVNAQHYREAAEEFGLWVHDGSSIVPALVARRKAEAALFLE